MDHRGSYFKGYARLRIQHLDFDPSRHIYDKKVGDLTTQFETVGCHNNDIANAVPVLIPEDVLNDALKDIDLAQSSLHDLGNGSTLLNLREQTRLKCIYGRHRIRAAQRHLCDDERSWVVRLYDADMPADLIVDLEQENLKFPNGRTLMYILDEDNPEVIENWLRDFSEDHFEKCVRIKNYDGGRLKALLQQLLRLKSLCCGMGSIGSWDPIYAMHCHEEMYAYLSAVTSMWTYILGDDVLPEHLDETTVLALQLLNPAEIRQDFEAIENLFDRRQVFSLVKNSAIRAALEQRVLSCKRIVSLESFFADFKLLRACYDGLKLLLPRHKQKSGRNRRKKRGNSGQSFRKMFELNFIGHRQANFEDCYEDLWIWAMRQFPYLSNTKFSRPLQHTVLDGDESGLYGCSNPIKVQMAYVAHDLYFHTEEISRLMETPRPEDLRPEQAPVGPDTPLEKRNRMGRPTAVNFKQNRKYLERKHVFSRLRSNGNERYPIAFLFWRDIAQCCWRTDARWLLAPGCQEHNESFNYNDRRARARDENQRRNQRRRDEQKDQNEAELTRLRAIARDAAHRGSEPRIRKLPEGVETKFPTRHTQETNVENISDLQNSIQRFLRDVPETHSQTSKLSDRDDERMEDGEAMFYRRSQGASTATYYTRPDLAGSEDDMKSSVEPLNPKARHSTEIGAGDEAQDQLESEKGIFEPEIFGDGADLIATYLDSESQNAFAPISRASSIYSIEEGLIGEVRQEPVSVTNATVDGLRTFKKESHEDPYELERLEMRELDPRRPITQIPISSIFTPLGNRTQDQGFNVDGRKIPASDRTPLTNSKKDESGKEGLEGVKQKREAYVPLLDLQLQEGKQGKHGNRLTQIPCGEDIVPLGLTNTTDRKRKRSHKGADFNGKSQSQ